MVYIFFFSLQFWLCLVECWFFWLWWVLYCVCSCPFLRGSLRSSQGGIVAYRHIKRPIQWINCTLKPWTYTWKVLVNLGSSYNHDVIYWPCTVHVQHVLYIPQEHPSHWTGPGQNDTHHPIKDLRYTVLYSLSSCFSPPYTCVLFPFINKSVPVKLFTCRLRLQVLLLPRSKTLQ